MTHVELHTFKTIAKRFARANRIPHHQALDLLAVELGQPHWNALTGAWEKGWRPTSDEAAIETAENHTSHTHDSGTTALGVWEHKGMIDAHPYEMSSDILGVCIGGSGWSIFVDAAPSIKPKIEIYGNAKDSPMHDEAFVQGALEIANQEAIRLRAEISSDWPRRSTKPDRKGGRYTR
ncbi:hypothetical protein [Devosia sp.]|uniref:hypothetical protein n=1 Tax=Devosia sp. TaxID=1871048 RepID=UPI002F0C86DD